MENAWVIQDGDMNLPAWLKDNLASNCTCGAKIENFYNPAGRITGRRCSNKSCPHAMAQKIVGMCEILGIKGIGPATAHDLIRQHGLKNHFEAVPYIASGGIQISLYNLLRCMFIQGISTRWSSVAKQCTDVLDLFEKYEGEYKDILLENKEAIIEASSYFKMAEKFRPLYRPCITGTVMLTGSFKDYPQREMLIVGLNHLTKGLVDISISKSKRKTGVMALVMEADSAKLGKYECAIENNIPVYTPQEFIQVVMNQLAEKMKQPGYLDSLLIK